MGSLVSLVKIQSLNEIKNAVLKALDLIDLRHDKSVKKVAIKPNLCYYWAASTGYTTDPNVIAGIIDVIRDYYGGNLEIKIVESDATAMRTKHSFPMLGYTKLAKEKKVRLFNLSTDVMVKREVEVNEHTFLFEIPRLLFDVDFFISVPKLKIMRGVTITCALKNLFGCIGSHNKIVYHPLLNEAIVGINKVLKPHLTIVDGLVALGKFPVKLDLIMASTDPFSIDWIAAHIMGYNPSKIKYLRIARKEKVGNPNEMTIRGENLENFQKVFPKVNTFRSNLSYSLRLKLLRLYSRIVQDTLPDELEE